MHARSAEVQHKNTGTLVPERYQLCQVPGRGPTELALNDGQMFQGPAAPVCFVVVTVQCVLGKTDSLPATLPDRTQTNLPGTRRNNVPASFPSEASQCLTLNKQSMGVDVIWDSKFILCLRNSLSPNPSASCGHQTSETLSQTLPIDGPGASPAILPRNSLQRLSPPRSAPGDEVCRSVSAHSGNPGKRALTALAWGGETTR